MCDFVSLSSKTSKGDGSKKRKRSLMGDNQDQNGRDRLLQDLIKQEKEGNSLEKMMIQSSASTQYEIFKLTKEVPTYDLGEIDQALYLYLNQQDHSPTQEDQRLTLNMFPSRPAAQSKASPKAGLFNTQKNTKKASSVKEEETRKGTAASTSEQEGPKTPDTKTLRRLAQNREAARKSRLRKKAYIQQLESSRMRLSQLEQELNRVRAQGLLVGGSGGGGGGGGVASLTDQGFFGNEDATMFDIEHARWLEDHRRLMCEVRTAVQEQSPEQQLQALVEHCVAHYEALMNLKSILSKSDVFHLVSGMWKTPAERCFMWIGGFRPSDILKVVIRQIEALSDQQIMGICSLKQWTQETEQTLSQGLGALQQSLLETITSDMFSSSASCLDMASYMTQMALAINKLSALEDFLRQADNLRLQSIHRLCQILTSHQAGRCFLSMAEYFDRLRALSSLWLARPRVQQDL